ncbi:pyroglutamyl-peptidase I [Bradyrhizobium sp. LHD-71]|uniref:pyroglutamyl-peptidase I n=1 Tax=Bradyrhizobium sp. LHD-71 TaxID=3072141 RepID=UPI00280C4EC9|nr:pyroglutamyl-peptidase I [Bradyrhizobium sp. LHD-71]MDQ8732587.1 pyroglutamyl-peptidase I [Bradyrhizobium sp. LHD-71]
MTLRVLITGFGPFPGAPFNPTELLVARLMKLRRPAFADIERTSHIFTVSYGDVDRDLPRLLKDCRPHILLMFGLAARTPYVRIETRARNAITTIWPDAANTQVRLGKIAAGQADALVFGPHTKRLLRASLRSGVATRSSRDAGRYLCNYLCWRAIETAAASPRPPLTAFIHVPLVPRGTVSRRSGATSRVSFDQLVDAGEAILLEMMRSARGSCG